MTLLSRTVPNCEEPIDALEAAGVGALQSAAGNLPLKRLDIRCRVSGLTCESAITQVFQNPHDEFVEATYIFPLPGRFAMTACTMHVGDRVIEAELKERSQARADYDSAIRAGQRAAIAEEERSEAFSLRVGNIPPHEEVTVQLALVGEISVVGGEGTLRIPLVVAPRYVSGSPLEGPSVGGGTAVDTDEVPDASRVTPPTLLPGFPSPVSLSVEVELNPGPLPALAEWRDAIRSSLHSVYVGESEPVKIKLMPGERVNRDFILRFPVLPPQVQAALEFADSRHLQAGTFALTLLPPHSAASQDRPRDVVFVLDRSGSMEGWKMAAARRAVARMVDTLRGGDRFRVLAFDDQIESPAGGTMDWLAATDRQRWQAAEWIAKIESRGGTELGAALRVALQPLATFGMPENRESIVVVITDGQVAGEDSVLRTLERLGLPRMPRIFTLGIDRAVNASMLSRLAELGGGVFELVESEERLDQVLERFHREIAAPVLMDVQIEPIDCDLVPSSITPGRAAAVFAGRPLTLYGRVVGHPENIKLRVTARDASGAPWQQELTARRSDAHALLALWGRGRVRDLEDQYARGDQTAGKLQAEIVAVSLESHVLSRFTAYVAVDQAEVVNVGGSQHQIVQPVELPEGWRMEQRVMHPRGMPRSSMVRSRQSSHVAAREAPAAGGQTAGGQVAENLAAACQLVPESVARENNVLPVREEDGKLVVRMSDPNDYDTIEKLRFILNRPIEVETASAGEIQKSINEQYAQIEGESADSVLQEFCDTAIDFTETARDYRDSEELSENSAPIFRLVSLTLREAVQLRATHVFLHPDDARVQIDYVIDGALHKGDSLPRRLLLPIVNHLRNLARIAELSDQLQQGEFKVTVGARDVVIRAYFIPTPHGQSVVLRLTDRALEALESNWPATSSLWLAAARASCESDPGANAVYQQLQADSR
jgi:Ca-activated chloride channel homolog